MVAINKASPVIVKRSSISGLGLYAAREFRRGQVICEYTGRRLLADDPTVNRYLFEINSKWMLDGSPRSNIGRWANHACGRSGNAVSDISQRGRVWLVARRRIRLGEEIVYNYGREYIDAYLKKTCKCGVCRDKRRGRNGLRGAR
jgi:SET domain-containing protein